jgi:transposase
VLVIGVDVHKQSVTAVAVDEAGRMLEEKTISVGSDELIGWAAGLAGERLWAVGDCRQLTRWLERQLLGCGEELVRVPPKLMAPEVACGADARQVRPDRCARRCPSSAARAGAWAAASRRAGLP